MSVKHPTSHKLPHKMAHNLPRAQAQRLGRASRETPVDFWLLVPILLLVALGITMVGSSSIAVAESLGMAPHYYLVRHLIFVCLGLMLALCFRVVPIKLLENTSQYMFPLAVLALLMVFVPGLGYTVNGSSRWVRLRILNFQVVEAVKVMFIIYMAGYLVRKADRLRNVFEDTFSDTPTGVFHEDKAGNAEFPDGVPVHLLHLFGCDKDRS